ncbi:MAG: proton-conducting transporter membrane subunit [Ardenticatenaceae bacterium]|nr:proton-conducting transporter membrane subunit [Ardenticatenaceae bacterium]
MIISWPILAQFFTALFCLFFWARRDIQRILSLVGSFAALASAIGLLLQVQEAGIQVMQLGNWPSFAGIVLVADLFSAIMVLITAFMGLMIALYAISDIESGQEAFGYHALYHFMLLGVTGSFLTGDLFNLFVWFEIMLVSSFVLLSLQGNRPQIEGGMKYVILNMLASLTFLSAIGLLFSVTGTVNMADIARQLEVVAPQYPTLIIALAMMFTLAFGMKSAVFPLFGWLPASYHTPPTAVTTIFGALLTKVGVYAMIRVYTLIFNQLDTLNYTLTALLLISAFTMVVGVFGAVSQFGFRRLLSFHIISQIGYLIMGLAVFTVASIAGTIFFMVHVILAKAALFLVSGIVKQLTGTNDLKQLGGFYNNNMALSMLFFIPAMALAGIPPLSGFWAKFAIIKAALESGSYWIVGVGLFVSMLTLYSMVKIWTYVFMRARPEAYDKPLEPMAVNDRWLRWTPTILIGGLTVLMGIYAGPLMALSTEAAEQLMAPAQYIGVVLGGAG